MNLWRGQKQLFVRGAGPNTFISSANGQIARLSGVPAWRKHHFFIPRRVQAPNKSIMCAQFSSFTTVKTQKKQPISVDEEERISIAWWQTNIKMCKKVAVKELSKRLVSTNLLGLDTCLRNGSLKEGSLTYEMLEVKRKFPHEVLLCRIGEFYEAVGFDACMLVEHAGLNPMGGMRADTVPRAGCPVQNLRQTLEELTAHGLSVCIMEEVQGPTVAKQRKDRFVAGHARPGSPYIYGLAGADVDLEFPDPVPVIGISRSMRGYCVVSVLETLRTFSVEDGLSEEAVVTKLRSMHYQQLFLHRSLRENVAGNSSWRAGGEGGLLWGECQGKPVHWFDKDPIHQFLLKVREEYDLGDEELRRIVVPNFGRPRPIYVGMASQIGVLPTQGVPSLIKVLFSSECSGLCTSYMRDLLLNPPPYNVATSIQAALKLMAQLKCSVPDFTCVSAAKLVKLIGAKEANHIELSRVRVLAEDVLYMCNAEDLRGIFQLLLEPTALATGLKFECSLLINDCRELVRKISNVISEDDQSQSPTTSTIIPNEFFHDQESSWRGRVQRRHVEAEFADVDEKAKLLIDAVEQDFLPIVQRSRTLVRTSYNNSKVEVYYSREHESIVFKGKGFKPAFSSGTPVEEQIKSLKPAIDSKNKRIGEDWHTTDNVELALGRYRDAATKANLAVIQTLKRLAQDLRENLNTVVFISVFCIIAKTLFGHVSEGKRRQWNFPTLTSKKGDKNQLMLDGLVPYWLDRSQSFTVPSSITMDSIILLTGPNGGGKSSLLRSVCVASLLGICGLMVPAVKAVIPHFDSIMLRVISQDSPADSKSLFQMEMSELKTILTEATSDSLVLVDELCKGTEVEKGTCLLGSVIETLDKIGCMGIFSTHLHGLLDMKLNVKNVVRKAMGTREVNGYLEATWELVDGECRESLAFETARNEGVPAATLQRAQELYTAMREIRQSCRNELSENIIKSVTEQPTEEISISLPVDDIIGLPVRSKLKDVEDVVLDISKKMLVSNGYDDQLCLNLVGARQQPPPSTTNRSCVYVLQRPDGKFYVGQTDDLTGRIGCHRSVNSFRNVEFIYMMVSNKSVACHLETTLINQLSQMGYDLVNKCDQKHRHFGTAAVTSPPF